MPSISISAPTAGPRRASHGLDGVVSHAGMARLPRRRSGDAASGNARPTASLLFRGGKGEIETALAAVSAGSPRVQSHCCATQPSPTSFTEDVAWLHRHHGDGIAGPGWHGVYVCRFLSRPAKRSDFFLYPLHESEQVLADHHQTRTIAEADRRGRLARPFQCGGHDLRSRLRFSPRLRGYGADRAMSFDGRNRLLRTTGPFAPFQRWLDLGVGYGSTTVNQHRLDIAILDSTGRPHAGVVRLQWDEADVLAALKALPSSPLSAPHGQ